MKREAFDHPKMRKLARRLDLPLFAARGIAESLWHVTARYAPQGDIGRFEDEDIADQIGWNGEAEPLIEALVSVGFLDRCECRRLIVHDWHQHADNGVRQRLSRQGLAFVGVEPEQQAPEAEAVESGCEDHSDDSEPRAHPGPTPGGTPGPTPGPSPALAGPGPGPGRAGTGTGAGPGPGSGSGSGGGSGGKRGKPPPEETDLPPPLDTDAFRRTWREWCRHRREIGAALKPTTVSRQLPKLERMGHDRAIASIEQSIEHGWRGLFDPREGRQSHQHGPGRHRHRGAEYYGRAGRPVENTGRSGSDPFAGGGTGQGGNPTGTAGSDP